MLSQMAIESFEDNLFYAAWDNIAKPHVEKVLDGLIPVTDKNDWVNNALRESALVHNPKHINYGVRIVTGKQIGRAHV